MPINKNNSELISITEENFEKGVNEAICKIIEIIKTVSSKYFTNGEYQQNDMVNFYLNIFANVLFSIHVQVLLTINQNEIEKLMKIFSAHIMRIFLHQKESKEHENKSQH